jgi:hypothetical protein
MMRTVILVISLLIDPAITAAADTPACSQVSNLPSARIRWAAVRKSRIDPAHNEESCRSYSTNFFEAVNARQAATYCSDVTDRQRTLELLDTEIDAFNELIASKCSS